MKSRKETGRNSVHLVEEYFSARASFYAALGSPARSWGERITHLWWAPLSHYRRLAFVMVGDFLNRRILDVGCGTGDAALVCAARGGIVTAIDLSQSMIEIAVARSLSASLDPQIRFLQCNFEDWTPLPGEYFDAILALTVLEYAPNPAEWLTRFASIANQIITTFPSKYSALALARRAHYALRGRLPCRFFSRRQVIALLVNSGMKIVTIHRLHGTYLVHAISARVP